jgi:hypothetical protein
VGTWGIPERWATWIIEHSTLDDEAKTTVTGIGAALNALPHVGIILSVAIPAAIIAARIMAEGIRAVTHFAIDSKRYPYNTSNTTNWLQIARSTLLIVKTHFSRWRTLQGK